MRNLVERKAEPDARTVRIAGVNIDVVPLQSNFTYNMQNEDATDLERRVRLAAQNLALDEDREVIGAMNVPPAPASEDLQWPVFIAEINALRGLGVQRGFGVAVSVKALTTLETQVVGIRSGMELVERAVDTKIALTNALDGAAWENLHAVLFQADPAAFRLVHAYGPRLRVTGVEGGTVVNLRLEEGIAIGVLTPDRCRGIRLQQ
jgi:hypothetical protein